MRVGFLENLNSRKRINSLFITFWYFQRKQLKIFCREILRIFRISSMFCKFNLIKDPIFHERWNKCSVTSVLNWWLKFLQLILIHSKRFGTWSTISMSQKCSVETWKELVLEFMRKIQKKLTHQVSILGRIYQELYEWNPKSHQLAYQRLEYQSNRRKQNQTFCLLWCIYPTRPCNRQRWFHSFRAYEFPKHRHRWSSCIYCKLAWPDRQSLTSRHAWDSLSTIRRAKRRHRLPRYKSLCLHNWLFHAASTSPCRSNQLQRCFATHQESAYCQVSSSERFEFFGIHFACRIKLCQCRIQWFFHLEK